MIEVLEPRRVLSSANACPNEYGGYHDSQFTGNVVQDFNGNNEQDSGFDDSLGSYGDTTLTAAVGDHPSNGTLELNPDGSFVYTPDAGFAGVDSFTYTVSCGGATSDPATVSLNVSNSAPLIDLSTSTEYSMYHDEILGSSWDSVTDAEDARTTLTHSIVDDVQHGTLDFHDDGTFVYTPEAGYVGPDSFSVKFTDPLGAESEPVTLQINVGNNSPFASDDSGYFDLAGATLSVNRFEGVLANDIDQDETDLANLTVTLETCARWGTASLSSDGSFTYSVFPESLDDPEFGGSDTFTYKINDGHEDGNIAIVEVSIGIAQVLKTVFTDDPTNPFAPQIATQVDDTNGNSDIVVGEEAQRTVAIKGANAPPMTVTWTIDGDILKSYDLKTGTKTPLGLNDLKQISPAWFWTIDEGDRHVSVTVSVGSMSVSVGTDFNVTRPEVNVDVRQSIVMITNGGNNIALGNALGGGTTNGIELDPSIAPGLGELKWVQIIDGQSGSKTLRHADGSESIQTFNATNSLDIRSPYSDDSTLVDSPTESTGGGTVGGNFGVAVSITRYDSFTSYLMFRSLKTNASWVPVRVVGWWWGFTADRTSVTAPWSLTSSSMGHSPPASADAYPSWSVVLPGTPPWQWQRVLVVERLERAFNESNSFHNCDPIVGDFEFYKSEFRWRRTRDAEVAYWCNLEARVLFWGTDASCRVTPCTTDR